MRLKNSFSARLSIDIIIVTSILFLLAITAVSLWSHKLIVDEATNSANNLLNWTITEIEKQEARVEDAVKSASWIVMEKLDDDDELYHITDRIVGISDVIIGSSIAFEKCYRPDRFYFAPYTYYDAELDKNISKQLGDQTYDYFYMDWYQIPSLTGKPCWSEPYYDEGGGGYLMSTYSYPLKDDDGHVFAIMTADISLQWISEMLSTIKPYPNSYVSLVSRGGIYINIDNDKHKPGETVISQTLGMDDPQALSIAQDMVKGGSGCTMFGKHEDRSFAVYGPLDNGWSCAIICTYKDVLQRADKMQLAILLISLLFLVILFLLSYYRIKMLTKPLSSFTDSVMQVAEGDFSATLPEIGSQDEIKKLRDSFEYMQHSLTNYIDDLKTSTAANERYANELYIASAIQMALLPADYPQNDAIDLHAYVKPAKEVGGDLYDFKVRGDWMYFFVGDVSGKGVPAALVMSVTKEAFDLLGDMNLELDDLVGRVNDAISRKNQSGMFITLFIGRINMKTGQFDYCNAGHNPGLILPPDTSAFYMDVKPNLALGVFDNFTYCQQSMTLAKGTRIVLYTDGVTEAERADKEQYGEKRLLEWLEQSSEQYASAAAACDGLYESVKTFTEGNEQNDDITIMTIKFKN